MARKDSAIVQFKLRIRETLRRQIERAAKARDVSANAEMMSRLQRSFDDENVRGLDAVHADLAALVTRISDGVHEINKQGDLIRAAEKLIVQVEQLPDLPDGVRAAIAEVKVVFRAIEIEAWLAARRAHTTGEQS